MTDYFEELEELSNELKAHDESRWAGRIEDAEQSGTTSSEILQEVGTVLRALDESEVPLRLGLRAKVRELISQGHEIWESTNG